MKIYDLLFFSGLASSFVTLPGCLQDGKKAAKDSDESLVLTIDGVGEEAKKYSLKYRLYCDSTEARVSEKLNSSRPTETVYDSSSIWGKSVKFSNSDVKKLSNGSVCVLDIFSDDSRAWEKFKWTLMDGKDTPVKGVFYVSSPGRVSNKKVSLTVYSTFVDLADTFVTTIKTTYPKELAGKKVTKSYLNCTPTGQNTLGEGTETTIDSKDFTATHKFNLRKSDFKDREGDCTVKVTVESKEYQSKSPLKLARNADGKAIDTVTEVTLAPSNLPEGAVTVNISFQSQICEIKAGTNGCVAK